MMKDDEGEDDGRVDEEREDEGREDDERHLHMLTSPLHCIHQQ